MLDFDPEKAAAADVLKAIRDAEKLLKEAKADPRDYPHNCDFAGVALKIKDAVEGLVFAHDLCRMQRRSVPQILLYEVVD